MPVANCVDCGLLFTTAHQPIRKREWVLTRRIWKLQQYKQHTLLLPQYTHPIKNIWACSCCGIFWRVASASHSATNLVVCMTSSNVIENDRKSISWLPWFTGQLVLYVIEHHNQSLSAGIWADMNYLSRITNVWIPWQSSVCVSRIIGDKIDVWNVNLKHFPYRHPLKVDERWPWTPMSSNEVQSGA